jgi:hypothetical protein
MQSSSHTAEQESSSSDTLAAAKAESDVQLKVVTKEKNDPGFIKGFQVISAEISAVRSAPDADAPPGQRAAQTTGEDADANLPTSQNEERVTGESRFVMNTGEDGTSERADSAEIPDSDALSEDSYEPATAKDDQEIGNGAAAFRFGDALSDESSHDNYIMDMGNDSHCGMFSFTVYELLGYILSVASYNTIILNNNPTFMIPTD